MLAPVHGKSREHVGSNVDVLAQFMPMVVTSNQSRLTAAARMKARELVGINDEGHSELRMLITNCCVVQIVTKCSLSL